MHHGVLGRALLNAAHAAGIGVVVTSFDGGKGRHLYVSDAAAKIFGRTTEEMLATPPTRHIAPQDQEWVQKAVTTGMPPRTVYELSVVRKDGTVVPIEVTSSRSTFEGRDAVFSFLVDTTSRRAAEEQRARNEAQFRALIEGAPEPVGIVRGGRFVYANRAYAEVLGYSDAAALSHVELATILSPEQASIRERREALVIGGAGPTRSQLYRVRRPDGSDVELEASSVFFEYEGQPAVLSMARDVTARKALERQLVQADRLAAIGTMAAGVAHEINNPLAYVLLNLDWVTRTLRTALNDPSSVESLLTMLDDARHGVEHVATIVRELKTFSRGDTETRMPVNLEVVAQSAIKIAGHEVLQRAKIRTEFEPAPLVWANDARLEQVVVNLLINAAQAMAREPGARSGGNEILVRVSSTDDNRVALEVKDNGCGIPPDVLPRIFDPFFTTKPIGIGTGLGLSICHGIVTSIGGTIVALSAPGEGTTFRVTLPVVRHSDLSPDDSAPDSPRPDEPLTLHTIQPPPSLQ